MAAFNLFKRDKLDWVTLPEPDNCISFFETIKSVRTGLVIGTLTTVFMLPFALFFGTIAGYFGGIVDDIIQYLYTTLSSIPGVLLITAMVLVMQIFITNHPQLFPTIADRADARLLALCFILGITSWASLCRLLRAETLKLREQDFVTASIAMGAKKNGDHHAAYFPKCDAYYYHHARFRFQRIGFSGSGVILRRCWC